MGVCLTPTKGMALSTDDFWIPEVLLTHGGTEMGQHPRSHARSNGVDAKIESRDGYIPGTCECPLVWWLNLLKRRSFPIKTWVIWFLGMIYIYIHIYQHLQGGAEWFRYRASIKHPLGFNWHPLKVQV